MRSRSVAKLLVDAVELRAGSIVTESEIQALKRRWSPRTVRRYPDINPAVECERLFFDHEDDPITYHVTKAQSEKGITWLRNKFFTSKGVTRQTEFVRGVGNLQHVTLTMVDFSHFELVNFNTIMNGGGMEWWFPVYACVAHSGLRFDYRAGSWQSGGFEILG